MAENKEQPEAKEKSGGTRLVFPQHLAQLIDQDGGYPFVKITNNEDEQTVCLPIPCLLYTSPSPRDKRQSRMPSSA